MSTIRLATPADAAAVATIYAPYCESSATSFEERAPSADEMARRISATLERLPWIVLEVDGIVEGYAYTSAHRERAAYRWSVDASVYIASRAHRRGAGRALYTTLFRVLADLGYFKVHAGITVPNPASVGLHEAMGFRLIGVYPGVGYKRGAWHGVAWLQLALRDERPDPPEPRSLSALAGSASWFEAVAAGFAEYHGPS